MIAALTFALTTVGCDLPPPVADPLAIPNESASSSQPAAVTDAGRAVESADGTSTVAAALLPSTAIRSEGSQRSGRWQVFPVDVTSAATLRVEADWVGDGNVNIFLRTSSGKTLAYANSSSAKPETLSHQVEPGTYDIAVLVKTGAASYTVTVLGGASPGQAGDEPVGEDPDAPGGAPPSGHDGAQPSVSSRSGNYAGQPPRGSILWGASTSSDSRLELHEQAASHPMVLHRSFFQWRHRNGYLLDTAREDLASGRLPWVSIKTPSWASMAAGEHDREIDELITGLDRLNGPVWLTIHHEPEGGGGVNRPDDPAGPRGHLAMNRRVRQRMTALKVDNIALVPVLMSYTWNPASGRDPEQWWASGVYDFLGVDHYVNAESSLVTDTWSKVRQWAQRKGVDVAVGEWGMRGTDAAAGDRMRAWYRHAAASSTDGRGARVIGLSAFDSDRNSPSGGWTLKGAQLTTFHTLLNDRRTVSVEQR